MPVFFCWEINCRISGSLKRSRVPSTAMSAGPQPRRSRGRTLDCVAQLPPEAQPEIQRKTQDRHDPGCEVSRIIPPRDVNSDLSEQRQHQQAGDEEDGQERSAAFTDLGGG